LLYFSLFTSEFGISLLIFLRVVEDLGFSCKTKGSISSIYFISFETFSFSLFSICFISACLYGSLFTVGFSSISYSSKLASNSSLGTLFSTTNFYVCSV